MPATDIPFISPALIAAARKATALDQRMPASIKPAAERRYAASQERRLVAELPFPGMGLEIPLHAYAG
ncbi:hypothetical protein ACFQ3Z_16320 [Streptomyces nogalater]